MKPQGVTLILTQTSNDVSTGSVDTFHGMCFWHLYYFYLN